MPRPSGDTEKRLLAAGRKQLYKTGLSGLRLRQVAKEAAANLGMFHYLFGSRDVFIKRLLKEIYADFMGRLRLDISPTLPPDEKLRRAITTLAFFVRDNRELAAALMTDALAGDREAARFIAGNFTEHVDMMAKLLEECRRAGAIIDLPLPLFLSTIGGSLAAPALMITGMEKSGIKKPLGYDLALLKELTLSDRAVELRVNLLLRALRPERRSQ
ncbi:MAG TPA: TetR/AcrR family transcriptional regulator [Elusimicrobiales bacterium]|nr:TetR/AcrR family transcriptional regulator [Elusimicrobiales bacterium]